MYSSVQETASDKGKGSAVEGNGLSASRNSNKGQPRGLKNPTKPTTLKKSATQSKLTSMSLTTREPETDVLELKGGNRNSLRKSHLERKPSNIPKTRHLETEKVVTDDGSSMTSGGAHVKSVQNELKEHATSVNSQSDSTPTCFTP